MKIPSILRILIITIICFSCLKAQDQTSDSNNKNLYLGAQYSIGSEQLFNWNPYSNEYSINLIEVVIRYDLKVKDIWKLQLVGFPQYNTTSLKLKSNDVDYVEGY